MAGHPFSCGCRPSGSHHTRDTTAEAVAVDPSRRCDAATRQEMAPDGPSPVASVE
jgi:hypothetical protein